MAKPHGEQPSEAQGVSDKVKEQADKHGSDIQQTISPTDRDAHSKKELEVLKMRAEMPTATTAGKILGIPKIGHDVGEAKVYLEKNQVKVADFPKEAQTWQATPDGRIRIDHHDSKTGESSHLIVDGKMSVEKTGDNITAIKAQVEFENGREVSYRNGEPTQIKHPDGETWTRDAKDKNIWHVSAHDRQHPGKMAHFDISNVKVDSNTGDIDWQVTSGEGKGHHRRIDRHKQYDDFAPGQKYTSVDETPRHGRTAHHDQQKDQVAPSKSSTQDQAEHQTKPQPEAQHRATTEQAEAQHQRKPEQGAASNPARPTHSELGHQSDAKPHQNNSEITSQKRSNLEAPEAKHPSSKSIEVNEEQNTTTETEALLLPRKDEPLVELSAGPMLKLDDKPLVGLSAGPMLKLESVPEQKHKEQPESLSKLEAPPKLQAIPVAEAQQPAKEYRIKLNREPSKPESASLPKADNIAEHKATGPKDTRTQEEKDQAKVRTHESFHFDATNSKSEKASKFSGVDDLMDVDGTVISGMPKDQAPTKNESNTEQQKSQPEQSISQAPLPKPVAPERVEVKAPTPLPAPHLEHNKDAMIGRLPKLEPVAIKVESNQEQLARMIEANRVNMMHRSANAAFHNVIANPSSFLRNDFGSPQPRPGDLAKVKPAELVSQTVLPQIQAHLIQKSDRVFEPQKPKEQPAPFAPPPPIEMSQPKQHNIPNPVPIEARSVNKAIENQQRKSVDSAASINQSNEVQAKKMTPLGGPPPLSDNSNAPRPTNVLKRVGAPPSSADDHSHAKKVQLSGMQQGKMDHSLDPKEAPTQKQLMPGMQAAKMDNSAAPTQDQYKLNPNESPKILSAKIEQQGEGNVYKAGTASNDYAGGALKASASDYQSAYSKPMEARLSDGRRIISANARSNESSDQVVWTQWHAKMESNLGNQIKHVVPVGTTFQVAFHINSNGHAEGQIVNHNGRMNAQQMARVSSMLHYDMQAPRGGSEHNLTWTFKSIGQGQHESQITHAATEQRSYRDGQMYSNQFKYGAAQNVNRNIGRAESYRPVQQPQQVMTYGSYKRYEH